jgi:hypothetical protein
MPTIQNPSAIREMVTTAACSYAAGLKNVTWASGAIRKARST